HVAVIDLRTPKFEFLVTPTSDPAGIICTRTTSKFLDDFKMHFAVNGDGFNYLPASYVPATYCPNGGDPVKTQGFAASRGKIYSPLKTAQPEVYISSRNQMSMNTPPGTIFNAVSGDRMVVEKGAMVKNLAAATPNPRTAYGLNQNGRWLTIMVIDGRQPGYSEGVTFPELANILISYGIYTGANMDGGGSSTMVIKGADGKPRVLNSPIDMNVPGRQRAVANHLGLYIKK
ncbi:MAG TPA: phosphodiester glycosidase family protein, partial [Anaerolineales bacterium]|nr:phosphodiester glycosidase family protein [Anaerolineales bacterium]